jgi:hypothetical protein
MKTFKIKVEEITFDLEDDVMEHDDADNLQEVLRKQYINKTFKIEAETEEEAHDELLEMVTDDTGWCIYSMESVTV